MSAVPRQPAPLADTLHNELEWDIIRPMRPEIRSTTILGVLRNGEVAVAGDGQVTLDKTIIKNTATKVRRLHQGKIIAGFAGSVADALALSDKFEAKLDSVGGNLQRGVVEFAKEWRSDRVLRRFEALMIVANKEDIFVLSGDGNVIEPEDGIAAIGSGGSFAQAAAKALLENTDLPAREIARKALHIAAEICIYTNDNITVEEM